MADYNTPINFNPVTDTLSPGDIITAIGYANAHGKPVYIDENEKLRVLTFESPTGFGQGRNRYVEVEHGNQKKRMTLIAHNVLTVTKSDRRVRQEPIPLDVGSRVVVAGYGNRGTGELYVINGRTGTIIAHLNETDLFQIKLDDDTVCEPWFYRHSLTPIGRRSTDKE